MAKLRFGLLGCGRIAARVLPEVMASPRLRFTAVAASDPARARRFAKALRLEAAPSYAALLERSDVDAVYVALPEHLHERWSRAAARAGKHVLCEKTLAPSLEGVRRTLGEARRAGVRVLEAFMWRFSPGAREADRLARRLGRLKSYRACFGYVMGSPDDYRHLRACGGGSLNDIGCYTLSGARRFLGEPTRVCASLDRTRGRLADHQGAAWAEFKGGALASLEFSFSSRQGQSLRLSGEKGSLEIQNPFGGPRRLKLDLGAGPSARTLPPQRHYRLMFEAFAAEVARRPRRPGSFEREALLQARAMQALRDSARLGRPVRLGRG